jgi:pimeloyl-ACP methyl ester carboxylesterase
MLGRNRGDWNKYARYLQKEDIAVISLDLRGHGESTNYFRIYWRNFWPKDYVKQISDLKYVVDFLRQQGHRQYGILGVGLGANVAVNYAVADARVVSLILVDPGLNYHEIKLLSALEQYGDRPLYVLCNKWNEYALTSVNKMKNYVQGRLKIDIYSDRDNWVTLFSSKKEIQNSTTKWFKATLYEVKDQDS